METEGQKKHNEEVMKKLADLILDAISEQGHGNANQETTGDDKETS